MPKRTVKRGKRSTRKMGGRKGKKGSRKMNKSQRKMRGGGFPNLYSKPATVPKPINWSLGFTSSKYVKLINRDKVYDFTWTPTDGNPNTGTLEIDTTETQVIGNISTSLASVFGKGLSDKYYNLLNTTVGPIAAASFNEEMSKNAGSLGARALKQVVFEAEDNKVTAVKLHFGTNNNPTVPLDIDVSNELSFDRVKKQFEVANGNGELDPAPPSMPENVAVPDDVPDENKINDDDDEEINSP
jgi:hypothetical protein